MVAQSGELRPDELAGAYARLVERAERVGIGAARGLTPREHARRLVDGGLPGARVTRLLGIVEACRYAERDDGAAAAEGVALCEQLAAALPELPAVAAPGPHDVGETTWSSRLRAGTSRAAPTAFAALALAAVIALASSSDLSCTPVGGGASAGGGAASGSATASRHETEVASVRSVQGAWSAPASRPTIVRVPVPPVVRAALGPPHFDNETGVDVDFGRCVDPFEPPLDWAHRCSVYPTVAPDFTFATAAGEMRDAVAEVDDAPYAFRTSVHVALRRGTPTPIPSPAPDAVVIDWSCKPHRELRLLVDEADALHALAEVSGQVELEYTTVTFSDYSFAPLPDVPFVPHPIELPDAVRASAEQVIAAIGGLPAPTFAATVRRLHAYFSGFRVAPIEPHEVRENAFLTIALARKGVCRHRARTFCIVAQALGLRARLVENRIHSFAEIELPDGTWRRLEFRLGPGEQPPVQRTPAARAAGAWRDPEPFEIPWSHAGLVALLCGGALWSWRRHGAPFDGRIPAPAHLEPRPARRARRDAGRRWERPAVERLLDVVAARLAARFGVVGGGDGAIEAALREQDVPEHVRPCIAAVLAARAGTADDARPPKTSELQRVYWNAYHVLQWLTEGRPW